MTHFLDEFPGSEPPVRRSFQGPSLDRSEPACYRDNALALCFAATPEPAQEAAARSAAPKEPDAAKKRKPRTSTRQRISKRDRYSV